MTTKGFVLGMSNGTSLFSQIVNSLLSRIINWITFAYCFFGHQLLQHKYLYISICAYNNLNPDFKTQIQFSKLYYFTISVSAKAETHLYFKTQTGIFEEPKSRFQKTNTGFQNFTILQSVYVQRRKHICI